MSDYGLAPDGLKQQYIPEIITESKTFETHGVSKEAARDYLRSPEGKLYWRTLVEADPNGAKEEILKRGIEQLRSGRDLPRMEFIDEPLVKIGPAGDPVHPKSPYFAKPSHVLNTVAQGQDLNQRFALPAKSEAAVYDANEIRPRHGRTLVFVSEVAPTSELGGQVTRTGGATQYLVLNRDLFTEATPVMRIGNNLSAHNDLVVGRGLGAPIAAVDVDAPARSLSPQLMRGAVVLGVAATVTDAVRTGDRIDTLLAQDNLLGARHAARDFAANNANAWAAAWATARLGAELGGTRRGVHGAVAGGVAGGITGYVLSDRAMAALDGREIANQTDAQGREWTFNRREWVRAMPADLRGDGIERPQQRAFSADFDTRRELEYRATSTATDIALRRLPPPRDPFVLAAGPADTPSVRPADWKRDGDSGQWLREVVLSVPERGVPLTRTETASPERTVQLDRESAGVVAANIATGPAAIAARYNVAHRLNGWETLGPVPPAVQAALDPDRLRGSDGRQYQLAGDGTWRHDGREASANAAAELSLTRATLRPLLDRHADTMAALPGWQRPTQAQQDLSSLARTYTGHGVAPDAESLAAIQLAVNATRARHGIDAANTSLALDPEAQGPRNVDSPLMHLHTDRDGVVRVLAVTTAEDIGRAREALRTASRETADGIAAPRDAPAQSATARDAAMQPVAATDPNVERFLRALETGDEATAREASKAFAASTHGQALAKEAEVQLLSGYRDLPGRDHPLFAQALGQLERLGPEAGGYRDRVQMEDLAGAVAAEAAARRMPAIDTLALDGERLAARWSSRNGMLHEQALIDIGQARPLEGSLSLLREDAQQKAADALQRTQQPSQDAALVR